MCDSDSMMPVAGGSSPNDAQLQYISRSSGDSDSGSLPPALAPNNSNYIRIVSCDLVCNVCRHATFSGLC